MACPDKSSWKSPANLLQDLEYCGAEATVLDGDGRPIEQYIFISVRKSGTIRRPFLINITGIIHPKEWARGGGDHIISISVPTKVSVHEICLLHLQMLADALDIRRLEARRVVFAAGSAIETVYLLKSPIVHVG